MLALNFAIWQRFARAMRTIFGKPAQAGATQTVAQASAPTFADLAFAEVYLLAQGALQFAPSIANHSSAGELAAALTTPLPSAKFAGTAQTPPTAARLQTSQRTTARPLAIQLAVTAARNVPKGQKSRSSVAQSRRPQKAKSAAKITVKKRAPKRRHVWLSNQTRIIRPVAINVVPLARQPRATAKPTAQKSPSRALRLAA
jgi:hypothetical protein